MTKQYWITGASGDWSTAADWVSGVVPGAVVGYSDAAVNGTAAAGFFQPHCQRRVDARHVADCGRLFAVDVERGNAVGAIDLIQ
jgi:hypothetical protein